MRRHWWQYSHWQNEENPDAVEVWPEGTDPNPCTLLRASWLNQFLSWQAYVCGIPLDRVGFIHRGQNVQRAGFWDEFATLIHWSKPIYHGPEHGFQIGPFDASYLANVFDDVRYPAPEVSFGPGDAFLLNENEELRPGAGSLLGKFLRNYRERLDSIACHEGNFEALWGASKVNCWELDYERGSDGNISSYSWNPIAQSTADGDIGVASRYILGNRIRFQEQSSLYCDSLSDLPADYDTVIASVPKGSFDPAGHCPSGIPEDDAYCHAIVTGTSWSGLIGVQQRLYDDFPRWPRFNEASGDIYTGTPPYNEGYSYVRGLRLLNRIRDQLPDSFLFPDAPDEAFSDNPWFWLDEPQEVTP